MRRKASPWGLKLGLSLLLLLNVSVAHSLTIEFEPDAIVTANGESIALNVAVTGLGDFAPDSLGAFDVFLSFDPGALGFTGYTLGGFLGDAGLFESVDVSGGAIGGVINLAEISLLSTAALDALQPSDFALATLNFDVIGIGPGMASVVSVLGSSILTDAAGTALDVSLFGSAVVQGRTAAAPVPGTVFLLLPFLSLLLLSRRT